MNVSELSSRLERLERENRMMKRAALAVGVVVLAVACIGAAIPDEIPETIEAPRAWSLDDLSKFRENHDLVLLRQNQNRTPLPRREAAHI